MNNIKTDPHGYSNTIEQKIINVLYDVRRTKCINKFKQEKKTYPAH